MAAAKVASLGRVSTMKWLSKLALWLILGSHHVWAESPDLWVLTSLEPPFSQHNERGQLEGVIIDVVKGVLQEANIDQQILTAPWERVFKEASSKSNVMLFALARTPEREAQFHWITPLTSVIVGVFSLQPAPTTLTQLNQLNLNKSIGVLDGDYRQQLLVEAGASNIVVLNNWTEGTDMLLNQDIENLFLSSIGIQLTCQQLQKDCKHIKRILSYQQITSYLALSKDTDSATIDKLSQAAQRYKQSDAFLHTVHQWISDYEREHGLLMHLQQGVINLWPAQP